MKCQIFFDKECNEPSALYTPNSVNGQLIFVLCNHGVELVDVYLTWPAQLICSQNLINEYRAAESNDYGQINQDFKMEDE